ncbi:MAG: alpha/beta fold hydrolase [Alphaproteobacteria bacterium]|nr:MAG: alpha/beta fold hydrolase [Alphaproteobacteria bacterium]
MGEKVLVIGTSTGGTLAALAALEPGLSDAIAGIVFVSPNFGVQDKAARLALLPFARLWAPLVAGRERSWEPANAEQAAHWTTRYPTVAGIPLMALVDHAARQDYARARMPALFVYSDRDQVIRPEKVKEVAGRWGGPVRLVELTPPGGAGGSYHVIAGDIVSPETTPVMVETILDWWRSDVAR